MKTWFENKWDALRTNFWFVPALMAVAASLACPALLRFDRWLGFSFPGVGAEKLQAVRSLLAVMVGALVTALSVVLSITMVVLTLAATQLGPRLLRTYIRDRHNQFLIGVFVSAVLYNLTALFLVGRLDDSGGIPNVTILGAFALSGMTMIVLVYFIHHVARGIQAPHVVLAVARELVALIRKTYPEKNHGPDDAGPEEAEKLPPASAGAHALRSGYIQAIDMDGLMEFAVERDAVIKTVRCPGDFVTSDHTLAEVHTKSEIGDEALAELASFFIIGDNRTATQDVDFVLVELVEIAVRALSPGINDPFTAITCIDRLAEALCLLATRSMPPIRRGNKDGALRLLLTQTGFDAFCNTAFDEIRRHSAREATVLIHLLDALAIVMMRARTEDQKQSLWRHTCMVRRAGERLPEPDDCKEIERRFQEIAACFSMPAD